MRAFRESYWQHCAATYLYLPTFRSTNNQVNDVAYTGEEIGSLSATCSGNPYEGVYITVNRISTTEGYTNPLDAVGECTGGGSGVCNYSPFGAPQFQSSNYFFRIGGLNDGLIPVNTTSAEIQASTDTFCSNLGKPFQSKTSHCSAELRLSGDNPKNKHPGSILSYDYTTTTSYTPGTLLKRLMYLRVCCVGRRGWEGDMPLIAFPLLREWKGSCLNFYPTTPRPEFLLSLDPYHPSFPPTLLPPITPSLQPAAPTPRIPSTD